MVTASQPGIESRPKFGPSLISPRRIFSRRSLRVAVCSHQGLVRKTRESIKRGDTTAEEVTLAYLDSIQRSDGVVGSFISITSDLALEQAKAVDKQLASGNDPGLLAGVPIAIKDNICISTGTTTAGSKLLQAHQSPYDAQIVHALKSIRGSDCRGRPTWMNLVWGVRQKVQRSRQHVIRGTSLGSQVVLPEGRPLPSPCDSAPRPLGVTREAQASTGIVLWSCRTEADVWTLTPSRFSCICIIV